ncbi:MAG: hypothetical protein V4559_01220 [Pseudomonadota bacterium]
MDIKRLNQLIEKLRRDVIGRPEWIESKHVFEYKTQSIPVVATLKLIRAAHGLNALYVLCGAGLFIDFGAVIRSINDCTEEIYFLLESYPEQPSKHVDQFLKAFFENTIDGYLDGETHQVSRDKIRSAVVRVLKGGQDDAVQKMLETIYKTFCGYTHANYAHVMEVYEGIHDSFNLEGVPSHPQMALKSEHIQIAADSVLMAAAYLAKKLNRDALGLELMKCVR